ncbi:NfeD family protein [Puteibacter caeruleilacunae]|nr:NfeD family protein [Puteibacter caeruleilacunae]
MEFEFWHIWLIAALIFFIMEIFIPSFVVFNFGVGALTGSAAAALDVSLELQIAIFCIGTLISFFAIRPVIIKYGYKRSDGIKTNVDAMIGRQAVVSELIDNRNDQGRIVIDGDHWRARSVTNQIIEKGEMVVVNQIDSIVMYVTPVETV